MKSLDRQIKYYEDNIEALAEKYEGQYLVISDKLEVSAFPDPGDAYEFGDRTYGLGNFLLRECSREYMRRKVIIHPSIVVVR